MPKISRWYARAGLISLFAGLVLGALAAMPDMGRPLFQTGPVLIHLLVVGWITQLIVAVMIWMFPIYTKEKPRGNERLLWAAFVLLNLGLILRIIGEPLVSLEPAAVWSFSLAASAVFQWLAGLAIIVNIWPRIKGR